MGQIKMNKKSRTEYSYLNIVAGLGGYSVSIILSMINRMVFTRTLPPEYLGISGLFTNILSMLTLAELGVGGAIVYALYKPLAENDEEKIASIVKVFGLAYRIIGTVIGIIGLCIMPLLPLLLKDQPAIHENLYLIYCMYLFNTASSYFFTYRSTLITAAQMNYLNTGINYAILSVQTIIQMLYLIATKEYIGYLIIQALGTLAYNVIISYVAVKKFPYIRRKNIPRLTKEETFSILKNMRDLMVYKVSGILVNSVDSIIITAFQGLSITGITSNYQLLTRTLNTLLNQIFNGLGASVGNLNAIETKEKRVSILNMLNLLNFWMFGWGAIGIIFVSSDLVALMFGEGYVLQPIIPYILAINFFTVGMMNAIWTFKHTMGLFKYGRFVQLFTAGFNLLFSLVLGKEFGLPGILFATILARLLTNLWYDPYVVYKIGFGESPVKYLIKYVKYIITMIISCVICTGLCKLIMLFTTNIWLDVFLKGLFCSVAANIVFFIMFYKTSEFNDAKIIVIKGIELIKRKIGN